MNNNQERKGRIAVAVIIFIAVINFVFLNFLFFREIFNEILGQLNLMLIYAVIACVPAVIVRARFGVDGLRLIAKAATIIGAVCCLARILVPEEILDETVVLYEDASVIVESYVNEWINIFTQCALVSSVPALYCTAFTGGLYCPPFIKRERAIYIALAPSFAFFLVLLIRFVMDNGLGVIADFIIEGSMLVLLLGSGLFAVWALILIFISGMIYRLANKFIKVRGIYD